MKHSMFRHIPSLFRRTSPIHLTFFVTRRCNARCPFCFYLRSASETSSRQEELTLKEIDRISRSLGGLLWLAFSGGEVFLRDDLVDIATTFYRRNRPAIMLFPTNGMLPDVIFERTAEILRSCPRSVVVVKLSLDGIGQVHDAVRDTPASFDRTMQTYELLKELLPLHPHFELGVNTVFCAENQDAMDDIIDHVQGMAAVRTHTISLVRGLLKQERSKNIDPGRYERAVARLESNLRQGTAPRYAFPGARIKAAQDILQRRLILRTAREDRRVTPCYAGRLNLVLTESGDLFPCEMRTDAFGNVRDHGCDVRTVLKTAEARRILGSIGRGECHCTHECYFMTNILFNPRWYPALAREYLLLRT